MAMTRYDMRNLPCLRRAQTPIRCLQSHSIPPTKQNYVAKLDSCGLTCVSIWEQKQLVRQHPLEFSFDQVEIADLPDMFGDR
jgi:hypothetical protein